VGAAGPLDAALAVDAIGQTLEIVAPLRRSMAQAPPGQGERFAFRRTDGPERWAVRFDGEAVRLGEDDGQDDGGPGIQVSGTASDLMLFLWQRPVTGRLGVRGESSLLERYFVLVPPV
jgi:hypothetical protein